LAGAPSAGWSAAGATGRLTIGDQRFVLRPAGRLGDAAALALIPERALAPDRAWLWALLATSFTLAAAAAITAVLLATRNIEGRDGSAGMPRASGGLGGHLGAPQQTDGRDGSAGMPRASGGVGGHLGAPQQTDGRDGSAGVPRASGGLGGHLGAPQQTDGAPQVELKALYTAALTMGSGTDIVATAEQTLDVVLAV